MDKTYTDTIDFWVKHWAEMPEYGETLDAKHHIDNIKRIIEIHAPFLRGVESLCELGIGAGRNIHYFHKAFPSWEYSGNDVNPNVHFSVSSRYPDVLNYADIEAADTLQYLRVWRPVDIVFSCDHLMHIPVPEIGDVCVFMAEKARKFILVREAFSSPPSSKLARVAYRFTRDYLDRFPGFTAIRKELQVSGNHKFSLCLFERNKA